MTSPYEGVAGDAVITPDQLYGRYDPPPQGDIVLRGFHGSSPMTAKIPLSSINSTHTSLKSTTLLCPKRPPPALARHRRRYSLRASHCGVWSQSTETYEVGTYSRAVIAIRYSVLELSEGYEDCATYHEL